MRPMATVRYHSLDALRGTMMLLGIYLHAAVAYSRHGSWPWKDGSTTGVFDLTLGLIHVFRMPVFYCLAGFFAAFLLEHRGTAGFLKNRMVRILVPFAAGWAVLFPLVAALERSFRVVVTSPLGPLVLAAVTFPALCFMQEGALDDPSGFVPEARILVTYLVFFASGWLLHRNADLLQSLPRLRRAATSLVLRLAAGSEGAGRPRGLGPHPSRELSSIRPVHVDRRDPEWPEAPDQAAADAGRRRPARLAEIAEIEVGPGGLTRDEGRARAAACAIRRPGLYCRLHAGPRYRFRRSSAMGVLCLTGRLEVFGAHRDGRSYGSLRRLSGQE